MNALTQTFVPADDLTDHLPALTSSQRGDGWTAPRQRTFLEALAEGFSVETACQRVGLSVASAYAFRRHAAIPAPPEACPEQRRRIVARREATDALFRAFPRRRT